MIRGKYFRESVKSGFSKDFSIYLHFTVRCNIDVNRVKVANKYSLSHPLKIYCGYQSNTIVHVREGSPLSKAQAAVKKGSLLFMPITTL